MDVITDEARRARLAQRHRLLPRLRTDDVVRIADDVVALHSTDPVTVMLSAMVRMAHPSIAAVEEVVYEQRALIRHHAMRRTLWLATPDTVRLMHAAATRKLVGPARRQLLKMLTAAGVADPEGWLDDAGDRCSPICATTDRARRGRSVVRSAASVCRCSSRPASRTPPRRAPTAS